MYVYIAIALAAALSAGFSTWKVQDWRYASIENDRQELVAKETARMLERADQGAVAHEKDKAEIRTEFLTITKEVERVVEKPIYSNVCFDDDGLRILASAISGSQTTSLPSGTVPEPHPAK